MHHGVDIAVANHLGDEGIPDIGPNELGAAHPALQILARGHRIDRDDLLDHRVLRQPRGQIRTQETAGTGDQHNPGVVRHIGARSA